jgi:hypothetical protein
LNNNSRNFLQDREHPIHLAHQSADANSAAAGPRAPLGSIKNCSFDFCAAK